jgi:membrane peptidoglycan carboxypeptidase
VKKTGWRRFVPSWKIVLAAFGVGTLATICMVGVAYAMVKVPTVNEASKEQGAQVFWSDGSPMMKIGSSRTSVQLNQISPNMQAAVLAAEDRKFYHESAISPTGIGRAVINDLSGGDTQGGSTITQQYVKNAYLSQEQTITRKFKEIFISVKLGKQQDKDTILQNYLNTIFFGRGASGVEAAAQAYYGVGVHAKDLTVPQAAVLAATIKQPGYYDPAQKAHLNDTVERYNFVLDGMVKIGKLSQADFLKYKDHLPKVAKLTKGNANAGQKGFMYERVDNALGGLGYSDTEIENGGLKVYTSWDKKLQAKAQSTVEQDLKAHNMPAYTRVGLVSMDPTKGEILAAYGGSDFIKRQVDDAYYSTAQVGSSFKPYVLAAALKSGISLKTQFNGVSPGWFNTDGDRVAPRTPGASEFSNDEANAPNPYVNLVSATADSLNTVFVPLGFKAKWQNVLALAKAAGLPEHGLQDGHPGEGGFFLGQSDFAPINQASGYSTIANDGNYITPHSIRYVIEPSGKRTSPKLEKRSAFSQDVARDVQYAMQAVVKEGTGKRAGIPGREVAGKTGTTNDNVAAWFSGFTPKQMVTTVGMWRYRDKNIKRKIKPRSYPLQHVGDYSLINGGDLPAQIWHDYMTGALSESKYRDVTHFDPPAYVGDTDQGQTPPPSATPTPTETPTCMPNQNPMRDHCKQDPNGGDQGQNCQLHPNRPGCPPPTDDPTDHPTCGIVGCQSTPTRPGGPGGGGGGGKGQETQAQAARPLKD